MKIGVDSVEVKRIEKILKLRKNLEKIYSKTELDNIYNCKHSSQRASGYFAVKEAFLKAIGIGINGEISLSDISISYTENGQPFINNTEKIKNLLMKYGFSDCEISITHTKDLVTAVCLLK